LFVGVDFGTVAVCGWSLALAAGNVLA